MTNEEDSSQQTTEPGNGITPEQKRGDFTTTLRVLPISLLARDKAELETILVGASL